MIEVPSFLAKLLPKTRSIAVILEKPFLERAEQEILDKMKRDGIDNNTINTERDRLGVERLKIDLVVWLKEFDGGVPTGGLTFSKTTTCTKINKPKFSISWQEPKDISDTVYIKRNMINAVRAKGGLEVNSTYTHIGY